jgi:nucleotide-binding universal stress UspA family protein
MKTKKRWMVGLDNSLIDKVVIEYTSFLANIIKPEKIYFINVQKSLEIPENIKQKFPDLRKPLDEKLEEQMKENVQTNFRSYDNYDIEYKVIEGNPFDELLNWISIKNIDLFISGRKKELKGSGILPNKLARKSACSILFIPEKPALRLHEIFVPVDFSKSSEDAFEVALDLAHRDEASTLYIQNIYFVPQGYRQTRLEEEVALAMKEEVTDQYNKLLSKLYTNGTHLSPIFVSDSTGRIAEIICENAHKRNADLIIMGHKGKTGAAALLMGSTTEKVLRIEEGIPVLVVK